MQRLVVFLPDDTVAQLEERRAQLGPEGLRPPLGAVAREQLEEHLRGERRAPTAADYARLFSALLGA